MFWENYEKWQNECIEELNKQGYCVSETDVEICEDGQVHFKGNFYLTDKLVTAWGDSEYYTDLTK